MYFGPANFIVLDNNVIIEETKLDWTGRYDKLSGGVHYTNDLVLIQHEIIRRGLPRVETPDLSERDVL